MLRTLKETPDVVYPGSRHSSCRRIISARGNVLQHIYKPCRCTPRGAQIYVFSQIGLLAGYKQR
jgi:hypothetical protein